MKYTIVFEYPEARVFAGKHKGAAGWSPTLDGAWLFDEKDGAERWLENGYGEESKKYGRVIEVPE